MTSDLNKAYFMLLDISLNDCPEMFPITCLAPVTHSGHARLHTLLNSTLIAGGNGGVTEMPAYLFIP